MSSQRRPNDTTSHPAKAGWRVSEWADAVGLCRASVYNLMANDATVTSVKVGAARIITISPADYLAEKAAA